MEYFLQKPPTRKERRMKPDSITLATNICDLEVVEWLVVHLCESLVHRLLMIKLHTGILAIAARAVMQATDLVFSVARLASGV